MSEVIPRDKTASVLYSENLVELMGSGISKEEAALVIREARARSSGGFKRGKLNIVVYYVDKKWPSLRTKTIPGKCRKFNRQCHRWCEMFKSGDIPPNCAQERRLHGYGSVK